MLSRSGCTGRIVERLPPAIMPAMRRRGDLILGIALGILLGIAILAVFIFVFSGDTVDAPSIDNGAPAERPAGR